MGAAGARSSGEMAFGGKGDRLLRDCGRFVRPPRVGREEREGSEGAQDAVGALRRLERQDGAGCLAPRLVDVPEEVRRVRERRSSEYLAFPGHVLVGDLERSPRVCRCSLHIAVDRQCPCNQGRALGEQRPGLGGFGP